MEMIREFFGFGEKGYTREPEGYMSWQHLCFVTLLMIVMVTLAVFLGKKARTRDEKYKNNILIYAAVLMDGLELFKIILHCINSKDALAFTDELPLFLCSIQLITIPLAALSRGRVKEASLDFVSIFGLLGAVLGTYLAGNNYAAYPVLSFTNVVSGITHSISGFAALYIMISGMASMKRKNLPITYAIITAFSVAAYIANIIGDYNYMFLMRGDGTPYDLLHSLLGGNPVLYPICVVLLFFVYILAFSAIFNAARNKSNANKAQKRSKQSN